jgi:hypothetical protein
MANKKPLPNPIDIFTSLDFEKMLMDTFNFKMHKKRR